MSSLGSLGGPGSPKPAPHPHSIPEDEEVQDPDVATLLPDLFSGDWGAEPTRATSAPEEPTGGDQKLVGSTIPLQAAQGAGSGSFVLRSGGATAAPPPSNVGQLGDFPGFSTAPRGFHGFQPAPAPPKKRPGILSSLTAGPAFLQKQLRKAQAGAGSPLTGGSSSSPPGKGEGSRGAVGRAKVPLKHAVTEPTSKLLDFLRDARAGGAEVAEPLIQQISSMDPQQEEPEALFLPASAATDNVPFYRRRSFWVSNLLLALWSLTFVGAGVGLFFEMQDCPTGCPGPKDTAWLLPQPPLGDRDTATPVEPQCACWGAPSPGCYNPATGQCSTACGCVSVADACYAEGCDAGKIDNDSIPWRVMFFLACIPVAAWASRILGWLFVGAVATVEAWAERKEQRQQQREAAARLQQELEQELQKRQQVEDEKRRALARLAELGSGKRVDGGGSGRLANGGTLLPGAPPGPAAQHKPIESVLSWQAGLLERAAASARLAGDVPAPLEHASILPPSPQKPAGGAAAALLDGASSMSEVAARPQALPKPIDVSQRSLAGGLARFLLGLEASYLAQHIRPQIQRCVFMGLTTGFWAIFWCISYNNVVPNHNQRFWVFFRVLLCITLMLVVNLITCFITSLAGIKLKRMNHRARMLEVSKRERLLQLLLSKGLEDEDDPRAANKLLPPELQAPEVDQAGEDGPPVPQQSLSWRRSGKLLGFGGALPSSLARLGQAVSTTFGAEKRSSSLPTGKGEDGDIEQAQGGGQDGDKLRRAATDKGPRHAVGRGMPRSRSGSGRSDDGPPSTVASPKSAESLSLANGGAGDSSLFSPSEGSAASDAHAQAPRPGGLAGTAGAVPMAERQRVALTSRTGDLSKAHMLADRERHFLEDELRLKYWNSRAEALPGPDGIPLTGREDSTVVSSEEDATSLGRFVFHRRLLSFVKLRAQLIKEAKGRQEAERVAAAAERARAARQEAAARAAKAAEAGGAGGHAGSEAGGGARRELSMKAVAESIPGLIDMFGSCAEDEEEGISAAPQAGGATRRPPAAATAPSPGRPVARTPSGTPVGAPPPGPFAGAPAAEVTRKQLFSTAGGVGAAAPPAGGVAAAPAGSLTARSSASKSSAGRREGLDKDMLRHFLEARAAGSDTDYVFEVLDRDYDDFVTEENVVRMVRQLYKDRLNLRKGLEGTNTILRKLDLFIGAVLHAIFIIFYLLVWGVAFNDSFYNAFSALLLAFSFIFQSTITNLYENVVFIFIIHPYDVGDMLLLSCTDCGNSTRHEVEEIHLNYTRFLDKENGRVWWPNRTLRDTAFINLTTSEIMEDNFHLLLDLDVAARHPDLLRKIKARLDDYCRKHRGEFDTNGTSVTYRDIMSPMGVLMKAEWRYSHPGTSKERCAKARTGLLIYMAQVMTELGVRYSWPNPFRPGDAPPCRGLGGHAGAGAPGTAGLRPAGRTSSSDSLPSQAHSGSGRLGSQPLLRGSSFGSQGRGGSMDGLGAGAGAGRSGPLHARSGSLGGGLQAAGPATSDQLQQLAGALGGEGSQGRVRRTESSDTVAADVPLHRLASMGEHGGAMPGSPGLSRTSLDGQAGMPHGRSRDRPKGADAPQQGPALAPAGRPSAATLAPTAAGRGARAALALGTMLEEPVQHAEQMRLLPEAQIP